MRSIIFALLLLSSSLIWASEISVGGVDLNIPVPEGYSAVTPEMAVLYEVQKQFVAPMNEEFVTFIPDGFVDMVLRDEIPELPRRFTVQTAKSLISIAVTSSDFEALKKTIKSQNSELMKKVEAQLPELMGKMNEGIKEKYDVDLALSISQMVPMPVHEETDRTLSYSSLVKYDMKDEMGNPAPFVSVVTATFVHIKGKVLFLYSYAEESDLEWSKKASHEWVSSIVNSNPSDFQESIIEKVPSSVSRIDWGQVGIKAVIGALVGLIIGLFGWLRNRAKKS
ncbi:hypothetical protein H0A36_19625 [Endozoicomonas sp. SM1973]|uniref:Uncharacterized protein n=1 Tax=Spartinivicinus marinus TaxID=2994442 RepID=A0A853I916_9GAMM|nr:hypothetical protein [Spartinivicinus marinus]MCX4027954.1 hypothetical protein [Spartinivicinus marinus]NYZ68232.1 hypothetical protein [Spartinivicinus marinus]